MNLGVLQAYIPAADTLLQLLGDTQRRWMHSNIDKLAPFLQTKNGQAALLMFLEEFGNFVVSPEKAEKQEVKQ